MLLSLGEIAQDFDGEVMRQIQRERGVSYGQSRQAGARTKEAKTGQGQAGACADEITIPAPGTDASNANCAQRAASADNGELKEYCRGSQNVVSRDL